MTPECRHIKTSGGKCAAYALRGQPYCYYHSRQRERAAGRRTTPAIPLSHELANLEDRGAIQHAITHVIMALADYQIDTKRAGILLYGLQLASSNAKDAEQIVSSESVAELTRTEEGEEMAPEGATVRPEQEESVAEMLKRAVVDCNPGLYEEYVPGQPLQLKQKKGLTQNPGGEDGTPSADPVPAEQRAAERLPDERTIEEDDEIDDEENDQEEDDLLDEEPESLAQWPLDKFGHPKAIRTNPRL
jgi:hypothetical protein